MHLHLSVTPEQLQPFDVTQPDQGALHILICSMQGKCQTLRTARCVQCQLTGNADVHSRLNSSCWRTDQLIVSELADCDSNVAIALLAGLGVGVVFKT